MREDIKIKSSRRTECSSHVVAGGKKYLVVTETTGGKRPRIASMVYLNGEILSTKMADCEAPNNASAMDAIMTKEHELTIERLKAEKLKAAKAPADYLSDMKAFLRRRAHRKALLVLREALAHHPDDPFILSNYGTLTAILERNHREGIRACTSAFTSLKQKVPFGQEFFYPSLFLNLGRAYLAACKKKEAIETFKRGLHTNRENADLLAELKKLGIRQQVPVPFLRRSNPLNKYAGLLICRLNGQR
jgi:tetratricopeptide (TPR) repeat protein